jgi:hypothetical protein
MPPIQSGSVRALLGIWTPVAYMYGLRRAGGGEARRRIRNGGQSLNGAARGLAPHPNPLILFQNAAWRDK